MQATRTFQGDRPLADASLLRRCEKARRAAVALGYRTGKDTVPKTVVQGETRRVALAKCERWEGFVAEHQTQSTDNSTSSVSADSSVSAESSSQPQPQQGKGPRYAILPMARPFKCGSCKARIFFVLTEKGAKVPVNPDGYSHFTTCPNASAHSKKNKAPKSPPRDRSGLPKHIKHLWAVVAASGLDDSARTRAERLTNCNSVLLDHGFDVVGSFTELSEDAARVLAASIDAKILTWGAKPSSRAPRPRAAANTMQGGEAA